MARHLRQVTKNRKQLFVALHVALALAACGNNAENDTGADSSAGNPAGVHLPSETITDPTKMICDSANVPDTAPKSVQDKAVIPPRTK
jgi:hypothetical protein